MLVISHFAVQDESDMFVSCLKLRLQILCRSSSELESRSRVSAAFREFGPFLHMLIDTSGSGEVSLAADSDMPCHVYEHVQINFLLFVEEDVNGKAHEERINELLSVCTELLFYLKEPV